MILRKFLTALLPLIMVSCSFPVPAQPVNPETLRAHIQREAQFRFGIPAPIPVIAGQIQQESAWNAKAKSPVGAAGLMQFMPETAAWAATAGAFGAVDVFNPAWSIRAGVWYDRWLYDRIKADTECDKWHFVLSSYNGGMGWAYKRQKKSPSPGNYAVTGFINPGIHPSNQLENQRYSNQILIKHQPRFAHWGKTICLG